MDVLIKCFMCVMVYSPSLFLSHFTLLHFAFIDTPSFSTSASEKTF